MFSLIITIISIALVAALALATIYYGGSAFNKGAASANASKMMNQSQQILAADRLYRVDHEGQMPPDMETLVTGGYLKSIPTAAASDSNFTANAAAVSWVMVATASGRGYQYSSSSIDSDSCKSINQMSFGQDGILGAVFSGFKTQCYGPDTSNLTVLVLSDPTLFTTGSVAAGLPSSPRYEAGSAPASTDWTQQPTTTNAGGSGGSGGSGSGSGGSGGSGSGSGGSTGVAAAPNQLELTLTQVTPTTINLSWRVASGPMTLADFRAYGSQAGGYMQYGVNISGPTSAGYVGDLGPTGGTVTLFNPWGTPDWTLTDPNWANWLTITFNPSYGAGYWTWLNVPISGTSSTEKICFTFPAGGRTDDALQVTGQSGACP